MPLKLLPQKNLQSFNLCSSLLFNGTFAFDGYDSKGYLLSISRTSSCRLLLSLLFIFPCAVVQIHLALLFSFLSVWLNAVPSCWTVFLKNKLFLHICRNERVCWRESQVFRASRFPGLPSCITQTMEFFPVILQLSLIICGSKCSCCVWTQPTIVERSFVINEYNKIYSLQTSLTVPWENSDMVAYFDFSWSYSGISWMRNEVEAIRWEVFWHGMASLSMH